MIKFLYSTFGNVPGLSGPLKAAYLGSLIKDLVKQGKDSPAKAELKNLGSQELDNELNNQATNLYDQHITPEVSKLNIPNAIHNPMKEKAIAQLVTVMRDKMKNVQIKK